MNIQGLYSIFVTKKRFCTSINKDRHTIVRWQKKGIPLTSAQAIADVLTQDSERLKTIAAGIRHAVLEARADGKNVIKEF